MKYRAIFCLIFLPQLVPALGAAFSIPDDEDSSTSQQLWNIKDDIMDKLGDLPDLSTLLGGLGGERKAGALKAAAQGIEGMLGKIPKLFEQDPELDSWIDEVNSDTESDASSDIFQDFGGMMPACAEIDCKKNYFMNEAMRWVKQALKDAGVVIHDNPAATTALVIGASVLVANIMSGGILLPAALQAIGFGAKGPIRHTIAAAMHRKVNPVQIGSMFSKLQSAAMGGAAMEELHKIANVAVTGLIGVGAVKLVGAGVKPLGQSTDFGPREWRAWESESKVDISPNAANKLAQLWGAASSEGCVAYGYREVRAPLWFVPEGADPLTVCVRTPASIKGIGYKTPLGCVDEGPKKGVVGMWYVPTNETRCMPQWNVFEDEVGVVGSRMVEYTNSIMLKGCMLYGRRRKFARLMGLKSNDDWNGVCESTSATIDGKHYDGPSYCEDKGIRGIYGVFDIVDKRCECSCVRV
ncbi:unnamed protein product [Rhizoctonia solani]|uniref:Uncharacterized protein n=1 Tax=Rhizoctonia solani TaxID=456999 RepID=A0A8H3H8E9_9AGAM|nr:unnamed protein product [Rhizoctonia solani]